MDKFPRYTREENRACTLNDEDIEEVRKLRNTGMSYNEIGKLFSITGQAVFYWCLDPKERKRRTKRATQRKKENGSEAHWSKEKYKEYRKRKKRIKPEYIAYENQFTHAYKKENRPGYKKSVAKSYRKEVESGSALLKNRRFRKRWGKEVWATYCLLKRHGVALPFKEIAKNIEEGVL